MNQMDANPGAHRTLVNDQTRVALLEKLNEFIRQRKSSWPTYETNDKFQEWLSGQVKYCTTAVNSRGAVLHVSIIAAHAVPAYNGWQQNRKA